MTALREALYTVMDKAKVDALTADVLATAADDAVEEEIADREEVTEGTLEEDEDVA